MHLDEEIREITIEPMEMPEPTEIEVPSETPQELPVPEPVTVGK